MIFSQIFCAYIDSFGGTNFWNRLQNIHNRWAGDLVWDFEQLGVRSDLLDRAIHRDNLKVKKETKICVSSRMMKRKVFCYSAFLYASV